MDRPDRRRAHRQGRPHDQTARQVRNLLRRLRAAGHDSGAAPLVILDAGYSAAALTAALAGQPVHLLVRLPATSVFYGDPATWPGKPAGPAATASPSPAITTPPRRTPNRTNP